MGFMGKAKEAEPALELNESALKSMCVRFPETVFMLGSSMEYLPEHIRENDKRLHLSIGSILDATPPRFVHLAPFYISRGMVTNGQYLQFLDSPDPDGIHERLIDRHDLWQYVWEQMNFRIVSTEMPYERMLGTVEIFVENYASSRNFIDAYIRSVRYEIERCFNARAIQDPSGQDERNQILRRLFACIRYKFGPSIVGEMQHPADVLDSQDEFEALQQYSDVKQIVADIDRVVVECKHIFSRRIDQQFVAAFAQDSHPIECFTFLWRVKRLLQQNHGLQDFLTPRRVLYPRYWKTENGNPATPWGMNYPWRDLPLVGVTLFEALAFCLYLQTGGVGALLPTEAEFECAASWPLSGGCDDDPVVVDPHGKAVYPWQEHSREEFSFFFGCEGKSLASMANAKQRYAQLLEQTRRVVKLPDGREDSLYQLTGFGWHWTMDRYNEFESKYNRFESSQYPRYGRPCVLPDGTPIEGQLGVFDYQPNWQESDTYCVLKGAPEIIGGPGLTTRRFAAYPLRGYQNVGFRWIIKD